MWYLCKYKVCAYEPLLVWGAFCYFFQKKRELKGSNLCFSPLSPFFFCSDIAILGSILTHLTSCLIHHHQVPRSSSPTFTTLHVVPHFLSYCFTCFTNIILSVPPSQRNQLHYLLFYPPFRKNTSAWSAAIEAALLFLFFGLHSLLLLSKCSGFFFLLLFSQGQLHGHLPPPREATPCTFFCSSTTASTIFSVCCYCSVLRGPQLLLPCKFLPWTCSGSSSYFYLLLQLSSSSLRCCKLCLLLVLSSLLVVAAKGRCCFHCWSLLLP